MISLLLFNHPDHASDQPSLAFPLESQEVDHSLINLLICNTIVNFGHKNMKLLGDCLMAFVFNIAIYRTPQPALSFAFSHPCSLYTMISNYSCMFLPTNRPYSSICFDNCTLLHPKDNTGIYLITAFNWTIFQEKWSIVSMTNDKFVHIFEYTVSSQQCQALLQTLCVVSSSNTITWNSQTCISPVHPHFHTPALLWGGGVRKGQSITGQPRSLKINNGWYCQPSVPFTASAPFITVCAAQSRLHIEGIHKILKTVNGWSLLAYKTHVCVFAIYWLCFCDTTLSVFWVSLLSSVFFPFIWCVSTKSFVKTCLKLIRSQPDIPQCVFLVFDMYNEAF